MKPVPPALPTANIIPKVPATDAMAVIASSGIWLRLAPPDVS